MTALMTRRPEFRRAACGGCALDLHGTPVVLRSSGALWIRQASMLVVADLHFEKGSAYGAGGQMLPPYDTRATLDRLEAEVTATRPEVLILLGDSLHDARAEARLDPADVARLRALAEDRRLVWAVGNHDADGPAGLPGEIVDDVRIDALVLTHEPTAGSVAGEVAGHLHPVATLAKHGARVRRRCFVTDGERLILPAFGAYAGGLNVIDRAIAGLFETRPSVVLVGAEKCHALSWAQLSQGR